MDPELLLLGLETDAAHATALLLDGRADQVDAYLERTGYRARLAAWRATRTPWPGGASPATR